MSFLEISSLNISYGDKLIMKNVNLSLPKGHIHGLLGSSGSGKTSLLRAISGFVPFTGKMNLNGQEAVDFYKDNPGGIGLVFQDYALFDHLTVEENITYGCRNKNHFDLAEKLCKSLGLWNYRNQKVRAISGGEKQRTALARALAVQPSLLLMDEPFGSLDPSLREDLRNQFMKLFKQLGTTVLFVTHDLQSAAAMAQTIHFLVDGEIKKSGPFATFYGGTQPQEILDFFGEGLWIEGEVQGNFFRGQSLEIPLSQSYSSEDRSKKSARLLIQNPQSLYIESSKP